MSIVFTTGCEFERNTDGVIKVSWENGNALTAIRGASVDYVDPKWHMACSFQGNVPTYEPAKDLGRLMSLGVDAKKLALVDLVRPFFAFVYGISVVLFDRKSTLLRSVAFKNNASSHPSATSLGKAFADELGDAEATPMTIWTAFGDLVQRLDSELHENAADRTVWDEPADWVEESDEKK